MEILALFIGIVFGLIIGFSAGYFFGKKRAYQSVDLSQQQNLVASLSTQIAEMKTKFEEIEKSRLALDKERERLNEEKENRLKDWMDNTNKIFKEITEKSQITANEKEKRIEDWMNATKKLFEEQRSSTEKFLFEQGKSREEIEKMRDAQLQDMKNMIGGFTRTVSGTKTRGMVGEGILAEVLQNSIQAGLVIKNLKTEGGEVEFAWKLDAHKYIPIDAKLPDIFELVERYNASGDVDEQKGCRKEIIEKFKKEIKNVQPYQNQPNTIDSCILVAPPAVLEIAPEVIAIGKELNVFVCSYREVFPIAHVLQEQYIKMKEEGDVGKYRKMVELLLQTLSRIYKRLEPIDKAITTIINAKKEIQDEVISANENAKRS
jgi:DNA recombination protein RmuC